MVPVRREEIAGLGCREFAGTVDHSWRIASFSMLTSGMFRNVDLPDRDDVAGYDTSHPETGSETDPDPLLSFPGEDVRALCSTISWKKPILPKRMKPCGPP